MHLRLWRSPDGYLRGRLNQGPSRPVYGADGPMLVEHPDGTLRVSVMPDGPILVAAGATTDEVLEALPLILLGSEAEPHEDVRGLVLDVELPDATTLPWWPDIEES